VVVALVRFDGAVGLLLLLMRFGRGGWELLSEMSLGISF
jgi:hypothetical protein